MDAGYGVSRLHCKVFFAGRYRCNNHQIRVLKFDGIPVRYTGYGASCVICGEEIGELDGVRYLSWTQLDVGAV